MTRLWFVFHNVIAHPLMVVLPCRWGDALHDWSAAYAFPKASPFTREEGRKP